ncbi:hypothetical protein KHA80_00455 [Anaerobacillus sp. HL2]|nr:hypothetical protein KHA80_00455 [Anaerobacillus sp. HL2]
MNLNSMLLAGLFCTWNSVVGGVFKFIFTQPILPILVKNLMLTPLNRLTVSLSLLTVGDFFFYIARFLML